MENLSSVRFVLLIALSMVGFPFLPALARSLEPLAEPHLKYADRPKILFFYANRAKSSQLIEPVMHANMRRWKEKIEFIDVDVDDPKNGKLVEKYSVGPIPAVIFVNTQGHITNMLVGYSGADAVLTSIKQLDPSS